MSKWFQNGAETNVIAIDDRGLQYGDGLFETIAIRRGEPRLWNLHLARLLTGCRRLGIAPPDTDSLRQLSADAVAAAGVGGREALQKVIVTRGPGQRGYSPPADARVTLLIGMFERPRYADDLYRAGVVTRICSSRLSQQPQTAGVKTLSRLDQVLARSEWQDKGIHEGLMLDQSGSLVCGTMSNLFAVSGGQLWTPEITQCGVSGVMRQHILALAEANGIGCNIAVFPTTMIDTADELFLSNSQIGIWPVARCGSRTFDDWPVTKQMRHLLHDAGISEGPR